MRNRNSNKTILLMAVMVFAAMFATGCGRSGNQGAPLSAGFKEFGDHVEEYRKLHKDAVDSLLKLKKASNQDEIVAQQEALVDKIRDLRSNAQRGDIFTPLATDAITRAVNTVYSGPDAHLVRNTILAGEPLEGFKVGVNQRYPDNLPFTTMPPTLLESLPRLPEEVAYRILGTTLLLVDCRANIIVDFMPNAIP